MLEKKNIDRVFQENFKDMEVYPNARVWNNIENRLKGTPVKRVRPLWQRISGIAVVFLLLLSLGLGFFKSNKKIQNKNNDFNVPDANKSVVNTDRNGLKTPVININSAEENKKTETTRIAANTKTASKKTEHKEGVSKLAEDIKTLENEDSGMAVAEVPETEEEKITPQYQTEISKAFDKTQLLQNNTNPVAEFTKKEKRSKKWSVGPTISPVFMNTLKKGSPISSELQNNSTSFDEALSYGIKMDYKLSDKFKLQSGINKVDLAYNTKNVLATISSSKYINHNIRTKYSGIRLSSVSDDRFDVEASTDEQNKSSIEGDLNQSFEYLEIPLELKYNIFESRVGLNLVGGFSTFILTNNNISMVLPNQTTDLGKATNLNTINFSGNVGFDIDYRITNDWFLNISPMVKYQFNTFSNNAGNFKPYYFGVYSGVNYKF